MNHHSIVTPNPERDRFMALTKTMLELPLTSIGDR